MRRAVPAVAGALLASLLLAALPAAAHDGHTNNSPTLLKFENQECVERTDSGPFVTLSAPTDTSVAVAPLIGLGQCTSTNNPTAPMFGDADDDALTFTSSAGTDPDVDVVSVLLSPPPDGSLPSGAGQGRIFFRGTAARAERDIRVDVTATDPHGGSASTHVIFRVGSFDGSAAPSLGAVSNAALALNQAMDFIVLPAATGGDVIPPGSSYEMHTTSPFTRPYAYTVSGLPPGLDFDAATRTISGTPTSTGTYTVTYSAEDADAQTTASGNTGDTASSTFTLTVSGTVLHPGRVSLVGTSCADCPPAPTGYAEPGPGFGEITVVWQWSAETGKPDIRHFTVQSRDNSSGKVGFLDVAKSDPWKVTLTGFSLGVVHQVWVQANGVFVGGVGKNTSVTAKVKALGSLAYDSASVNGTTLTVNFAKALDASGTMPSSSVFTVTATGMGRSPPNIAGSATPVTIAGSKVTATLSSAVVRGETVTLAYTKPTDNPLRDTDDPPNEVEEFSGEPVTNNTTPSVTGIDFAGVAPVDADRDGSGDSYRKDDVIEAAVTFTEAVNVTGTPTLTLRVGANSRAAAYHSGSGTATLAFRYTVAAGDADADGVSVPVNPIVVPAGAGIGDSVGTATLAYGGRAADASRKVDAVAPTRSGSIAFNKANGSAGRGDELRFTVTFSEPVDVTGTPAVNLELTKGAATRHLLAGYAGRTGARALVFFHSVELGDSADTAVFLLSDIENGGIVDAVGNAFVAAGSGTWLVTVDGTKTGTDDVGPLVKSLALSSTATRDADNDGTNDTYRVGDAVDVSVTFSEAVTADTTDGTPSLGLLVGTSTRQASYASGTASATLVFRYTVAAGDEDTDGVSVAAGSIALNGGTLKDATANNAGLAHGALAPNALHKVPTDTARPEFVSAAVNGTALSITFNEALDESVTPAAGAIQITKGSETTSSPVASFDGISGPTVTATLAAAVGHGTVIRVTYQRPTDPDDRLKDRSGNELDVSGVNRRPVTNNTPPAFSSAAVNGAALTVTFDGPLDTGSVPAAGDFAVTVGGEAAALADTNPVNVAGSAVTLTLAEAVGGSLQVVTVGYTQGTNPLRDADNAKNPVTGFGDVKTVTNNTPNDGTVPTVSSAQINGGTLTVTFSEALDENSVPATGQFAAGIGGFAHSPSSVRVKGATVTLAITPATHGQPVSVNYTKPTSNPLRDLSGNEVLDFGFVTTQAVTNNTPPAFDGAAVNGDELTITFDGDLATDAGSLPAGSDFAVKATRAGTERDVDLASSDLVVSGSTVTLALAEAMLSIDTVTVGYTPGTNTLKDSDNATEEVPGFSGKAVTNDTPADTESPEIQSIVANGTKVTFTYNEELDESVTVPDGHFRRRIGNAAITPNTSASVSGRTVTVTFAAAVRHGETVQVWYALAADAANRIKDLSGNPAAAITGAEGRGATNNAPPVYSKSSVNGHRLTITFDGDLATDAGSKPVGSDFAVKATRAGTERDVDLGASDPVEVSGKAVTLTLAAAVFDTDTVTVGYTPGANTLKDSDNAMEEVPGFSGKAVTNDTPADPPPAVTGIAFTGSAPRDVDRDGTNETYVIGDVIEVSVTFSEAVTVDATGGTPSLVLRVGTTDRAVAYASGSGSATLGFGYTVAAGDADTDGVSVAAGSVALNGGTVKDATDNDATLAHAAIPPDALHKVDGTGTQASVSGIAFASAAPRDVDRDGTNETYAIGDVIEVAVTFTGAVTVDATGGTPTLDVQVGASAGAAAYASGSGTATLVFGYTVAAGDADGDGASIAAGTIALNGGRIGDAAGVASLAHGAVAAEVSRLVDGVAPTRSGSITLNKQDGSAGLGDELRFTVTFSEPVEVSGTPAVLLDIYQSSTLQQSRRAGYAGRTGARVLVFSYSVAADDDGNIVLFQPLSISGGRIVDAVGNGFVAVQGENFVVTVDGSAPGSGDGERPVVRSLALSSTATRDADNDGTNDTYRTGDGIDVSVTFSEAVTVDATGGTPSLVLRVGTTDRAVAYASGSGSATLAFRYAVAAGDADTDGVSVAAGSVALNGGTLKDAAGNDATLVHAAIAPNALHKVDGTGTQASVSGIAFASAAPRDVDRDGTNETYAIGDVIEVAVTFTGAVTVDATGGTPTLDVQVGASAGAAAYASGSGTATLVFGYTVAAGDVDGDGASIAAGTIALNGGRIGDAAGVASLAHGAVAAEVSRLVDGVAPTRSGSITLNKQDGSAGLGDELRFTVTFSEPVEVSGTPAVLLDIYQSSTLQQSRRAGYAGRTGARVLVFSYSVAADDDGNIVLFQPLSISGGRIVDAVGNGFVAVQGENFVVTVDGSAPGSGDGERPVVRSLALSSTAPLDADNDGTNDTYRTGDGIDVSVTFSEAVTVDATGGTPSLGLLVGTSTRQASYASGSGSATLAFRYTVAAADEDTDGVSVAAGSVALNSGTLKDAAGNDATLVHAAIAPNALHKVDGTGMQALVTGIAFAGSAPRDVDRDGTNETYAMGDAIEVEVTFDGQVAVETAGGMPGLMLQVGSGTVEAAYASGSGSATLVFAYTVAAGDADGDGASIAAGTIALNGGRIGDAAGVASLAHGAVAAEVSRLVDGVAPTRSGSITLNKQDGSAGLGDELRFTVTFSEPVEVSGTPAVLLDIYQSSTLQQSRRAGYAGRTGARVLVFSYSVAADDDGNIVLFQPLSISGGRIVDAVGNGFVAVQGENFVVTVDGSAPGSGDGERPVVRSLALSSTATRDADNDGTNDTYRVGDALDVSVMFSEAVTVDATGGTPSLGLLVGTSTRQASYASGSGSATLAFRYTVAAADEDTDGVSVAVGSVALNSGTLKDAADNDATLVHAALAPNALHKVDGTLNRAPRALWEGGTGANVCAILSDPETTLTPNARIEAPAGQLVDLTLVTRAAETTEWPASCTEAGNQRAPVFDDADADTLTIAIKRGGAADLPENVREFSDEKVDFPLVWSGGLRFRGVAALRPTNHDMVLSATDPHDASVTRAVRIIVGSFEGTNGRPVFDGTVSDQKLAPNAEMTALELPKATGGDVTYKSGTQTATFSHYYEVRGLPKGLTFTPPDPADSASKPTISGTPTEEGSFTVTYTVDDADGQSANRNPELSDPTDTASLSFTMCVGGCVPAIELVRIVSAPTFDFDEDGKRDTFVRTDGIFVDVEFSRPVKIAGDADNVRLRLDLGGDDTDLDNSRRVLRGPSVLHGGMTLRFVYTVKAADSDTDGLWVQTGGSNLVVFTSGDNGNTKTVVDADTGTPADLTKSGLPTSGSVDTDGDVVTRVDGSKTAADTGPRPTGATVDGATLTVTFNRALDASTVSTAGLSSSFSVQGAGVNGGNRNAYQHPSDVSIGDNNQMLKLTLTEPARVADTVTLSYYVFNDTAPLKGAGAGGKKAPAFVDLGVTNETDDLSPWRASVAGTTLRVVFDGALKEDKASTPAGAAFLVDTGAPDYGTRAIRGTGTAMVAGTEVTVQLAAAVRVDEIASVSYAKPGSNPLRSAGGDAVRSFERFEVGSVRDGMGPVLVRLAAAEKASSPKAMLYFDEPLDGTSEPASGDFAATVDGVAATVSGVVVHDNAVEFTLNLAVAAGATVGVSYTPGENPIRDGSGNPAAAFEETASAAASGTPALLAAHVAGTRLKLTYDRPLHPEGRPAEDAFELHYPLESDETDEDRRTVNHSIGSRLVQGNKMVLHLASPWFPCSGATPFTVSYTKPTDADALKLKAIGGAEADGFKPRPVSNERAHLCGTDWLDSVTIGSVILRAKRPFATAEAPQAAWFRVTASGGPVTVTGAAFSPNDPHELKLTLSREFGPDETATATASYSRPQGARGLWDVDGNQLADITDVPVTVRAAGPSVTGVAVVSDAGGDDTYGLGETVRVRLDFAEAVRVDTAGGAPRLKIDLDPADWGAQWAVYEGGSDTASLTFAYEVVEPNVSTRGVAVLANTLALNGGTIRSVSAGSDAQLSQAGLDHDPVHKVDWRVTPAPAGAAAVTGVAVVSDAGDDDTYAIGETVRVRLTFDEAVDVDTSGGAPRLKIDLDPAHWGAQWAVYEAGSGTESLSFAYRVVEPNESTQGIAVLVNTLELGGGTIRSVSAGSDAHLSHAGLGHDPAHKVDWRLAPVGAATVTGVAVVSDAGGDDTYALGEAIRVAVTFSEAVSVDTAGGVPRLKIDLDPAHWGAQWAVYEGGSDTASLTFAYRVVEPNESTQGIAVLADTLELNGGTIRSVSAGTDAHLPHAGLGHDPAHKVDWTLAPEPPEALAVELVSDAGADDTYALGEAIRVTVTFDEAVDVDTSGGAPRLKLDLDPADWGEQWAVYEGGTGTAKLAFGYEVAEPNQSTAGIAVLADTLEPNGGTIRSAETAADANLGHAGLGHDPAHKVDWTLAAGAPVAIGVEVSSAPASGDTYWLGETIRVTVTFDEAVDVDTAGGAPRLKLDLDPADWGEQWAVYEGGTGTAKLAFAYRVAEPNVSTEGIAVLADTLELDGGTVRSGATEADANLGHAGLGYDPAHKVDWTLAPEPAAVTAVELVSDAGADDTYALGEAIRVRLTFDEVVEVDATGGAPRLKLRMDPDWGEKWAVYEGGTGTATLTFAYEVAEPNESTAGIAVLADTLALNGGTIRSAETAVDADLSHAGLDHDPAHKVDWSLAAGAPVAIGVEVSSNPAFGDTYGSGEAIRVTLTFDEAVAVDTAGGAPRLTLRMDPNYGEKWAVYEGGTGTAKLVFAYEVVEPNESTRGVAVLADSLEANGGAIRSAATAVDADLSHAGLDHDPDHKVDWTRAVEPALSVADAASAEGGTLAFAVSLDRATTGEVRVDYATADGTAAAGADYAAADGTLTFAAGETAKTVEVSALHDAAAEDDETLVLTLSNARGATLADAAATGTVTEVAPLTASFLDVPAEHDGAGAFSFELRFSEDFPGRLSYRLLRDEALGVTNGRATDVKRVAPNQNARWSVTVEPSSHEEVAVTLPAAGACGTAGSVCTESGRPLANTTTVTVDGPPPLVSVADARAREGGDVAFAVTLSRAASEAVAVDYATADGTATAGEDYTAAATAVAVTSRPAAGDTYGVDETVRVAVTFSEAVEVTGAPTLTIDMDPAQWGAKAAAYAGGSGTTTLTFAQAVVEPNLAESGIAVVADSLALNGGTVASAADGSAALLAHGGLGHDPAHKVDWKLGAQVSAADARVEEGKGAVLEFSVWMERPASRRTTVDYATADGTAKAGEDYTATHGTLVFATGEREKTVSVAVLDDAIDEGEESLTLTLSNPTGGRVLGDAEAVGTIENSDPLPKAWLARFGRTASVHVADAIGERLRGGTRQSGVTQFTLGGRRVQFGQPGPRQPSESERDSVEQHRYAEWLQDESPEARMNRMKAEAMNWRLTAGGLAGGGPADGSTADGSTAYGTTAHDSTAFGTFSGGGSLGPGLAGNGSGSGGILPTTMSGVPADARPAHGGTAYDSLANRSPEGRSPTAGGSSSEGRTADAWMLVDGLLDASGWAAGQRLVDGLRFADGLGQRDWRDALAGSSFEYTRTGAPGAEPRGLDRWSAWGRGAQTRFSGADGPVSITGDVVTATVGADARWGRWTGGVAVSHSLGEGSYSAEAVGGGVLASTLTSLNPYGGVALNARVSLWGVLGVGVGELTLTPEGADAIETDLGNAMAAFGTRAVFVRRASGLELAVVSDALYTNTVSDAAEGLMGAEGDASRVRLMLEGSRAMALWNGATLRPTLEAGVRYDGGDAETGAGVELGGALAYESGRVSVELKARSLVAHRDENFQESGYSVSMKWQPGEDGRGLSMNLGSSWGDTGSGVDALWGAESTAGLARGAASSLQQRMQAELGYGLEGRKGRALWMPFLAAEAGGGNQTLRTGLKLTSGTNVELGLELGRRKSVGGGAPEDALRLQGRMRW